MSKSFHLLAVAALLGGLAIGGGTTGRAQTATDPHHPKDAPAAKTGPVPGDMMGGMMGRGMHGMMAGGMMQMMSDCPMMGGASHAEGRIAFLRAELGITDAQKAVWEAYAAQLKANLQGMQGMQSSMMAMMDAKSAVERLDARIAMMEGRSKALKDIKPTLAALYTALSADQRKKADQLLTGMGCMM